MISDEQLEALASILFETQQQSFRETGARGGLILKLPFSRQPHAIRQAWKDVALAAYLHIVWERVPASEEVPG